jgi:rhamnosyltransferase
MNSLPNYFNTIIVVITYNPDWGFRDRIKRYVEIADKTIIVDNALFRCVSIHS